MITVVLVVGLGIAGFRAIVGPPPVAWTRSYMQVMWRVLSEHRKGLQSFLYLLVLIVGPFVIPLAIAPLMERAASSEIQAWPHWRKVELAVACVVCAVVLQLLQRSRR